MPEVRYLKDHLDKKIAGLLKKKAELEHENSILKNECMKMLEDGFEHIYFINIEETPDSDHEGTVDRVHLTDLGFMRYADHLIRNFREFGLDPGPDK